MLQQLQTAHESQVLKLLKFCKLYDHTGSFKMPPMVGQYLYHGNWHVL